MWPWLLPVGSALLGGYEGYKQSGGNLGTALLAAGASAAAPSALRYAGTALAETPAVSALLGKASTALGEKALQANLAARTLGTTGTEGLARTAALQGSAGLGGLAAKLAVPAAIGGGTAALGSMFVPQLAGKAATAISGGAQDVAGGAAAMGAGRPGAPDIYQSADNAVPNVGQFGPMGPYGTSFDVMNPLGGPAGTRTEEEMEQDVNVRGIKKLQAVLAPIIEQRSKAEFERQMAAAGIRQNIATQAAMLQNAQTSAQQMGRTAAQQMGQALAAQYQYS